MPPIISSSRKLTVSPQPVGVIGTLNCCVFSLYNSGILGTTVSPLYLKDAILFLQGFLLFFSVYISSFCKNTLYACYVFNVIDGFF